jgi:uncharacterized membrane protein YfcA
MVLHGVTQFASNGFRWFLQREHTYWRGMLPYVAGAAVATVAFRLAAFIPDKAVVYFVLGALPFVVLVLPEKWRPDFCNKMGPPLSGAVVTGVQLMAGAAGPALDVFFTHTELSKRQVVATKALTQTIAHAIKIAYFTLMVASVPVEHREIPWWLYLGSVVATFVGTWLGGIVLAKFSEDQFRRYTRRVVLGLGVYYLYRAFALVFAQ